MIEFMDMKTFIINEQNLAERFEKDITSEDVVIACGGRLSENSDNLT